VYPTSRRLINRNTNSRRVKATLATTTHQPNQKQQRTKTLQPDSREVMSRKTIRQSTTGPQKNTQTVASSNTTAHSRPKEPPSRSSSNTTRIDSTLRLTMHPQKIKKVTLCNLLAAGTRTERVGRASMATPHRTERTVPRVCPPAV
jgi:hypothetical protein